ncbi:DUF885 domain-containing protein [Deinococcus sp. SDU3-2]|uniref:DUF885 domain-containing protein n=1 Tax=Deinococcus terrestris TaxID=2651870 RepID=A0A7X1NY35_9DEIO|nr:DUF885 family protein [Deinococcus terrestris]MPY67897.1 DUF885 domain-containing protein [Deinococcus terrestris]
MTDASSLAEDYLRLHAQFRPVDATFMGLPGHDHQLPPAGPDSVDAELDALRALRARVETAPEPTSSGTRLDARLLNAQLALGEAELQRAPRLHNPAWATGEAAFSVISLLLPGAPGNPTERGDALRVRLEALPGFLGQARAHLQGRAAPQDWTERGRREACAAATLLEDGLPRHPLWHTDLQAPAFRAARALRAHADELAELAPVDDVACGEAHLDFLMRVGHGLSFGPREALEQATLAFERLTQELEHDAARLDPSRSWQEQLAALEHDTAEEGGVLDTYRVWHERALEAASGLVTPERTYTLDYRTTPDWAVGTADLYFLFYRSPAPRRPGSGSVYWVFPPGEDMGAYLRAHNTSAIKLIHAVHHGSIGHHTHNARAREAASVLARVAGTDCASGIAMLGAGTSVEGWACYAEDLLLEAEGFYTPAEALLLKSYERRNAASCMADIKLHLGEWSLEEMRVFYRDRANFAPARIWSETTRNSMFPATRLMYWLGTEAIKNLRTELNLPARVFHDALLAHGHAPMSWIAEEMRHTRAQETV